MLRIYSYLVGLFMYPFARLYLEGLSFLSGMRSLVKRDQHVSFDEFQSGPVLLLALFEKGDLRPDIKNLILRARNQGYYVIAVNNGKIGANELASVDEAIPSYYIERYNFGRDFGSYKSGALFLYKNKKFKNCSRVIIMNDSVFYSDANLNSFLCSLNDSRYDVIGATCNPEISFHLGSFCISMSAEVFFNSKMARFWKRYRKSDIRPTVIKRGEMKLSQVLMSIASPSKVEVLFDKAGFLSRMATEESEKILNDMPKLMSRPQIKQPDEFQYPSFMSITDGFVEAYSTDSLSLKNLSWRLKGLQADSISKTQSQLLFCPDDVVDLASKLYPDIDIERFRNEYFKFLTASWGETIETGSQVHFNCILFARLGLPFAKLDLVFRGVASVNDIEALCEECMSEDEAAQFRRLVYGKAWGHKSYVGWRLAAFNRGLL